MSAMTTSKIGICVLALAVRSSDCEAREPVERVVSVLLKAHNRERRRKDLDDFTLSPRLCAAAQIHARDMASHQMISHTGTDGSAPADRIKRVGYIPRRTGENCAEGQWDVGEVMAGWMKSPGHRANILSKFTEMGAAWARDEEGTIYWCVDFGTLRFRVPKSPVNPDEVAAAVVKEINRDRQAGRMVLLQPDPKLARAAMALSTIMAASDSLKMDRDPLDRIDKTVSQGRDIRLEVCARVTSSEQAAKALHTTEGEQWHSFREIGVGYAVAKSGTPYWCAIFARPVERETSTGPE